jgi:cytochrome bd-type quinol oxidase subunit 2
MKILSLILCVLVFLGAGYFLIIDFQTSLEMNSILYMSLLVILMLICVVGVLINYPLLMQQRKNVKTTMYNSYSSKRIINREFDRKYGMQH